MTERMEATATPASALQRIADGQERLVEVLATRDDADGGLDAESRMRLRSIDVQMLRCSRRSPPAGRRPWPSCAPTSPR